MLLEIILGLMVIIFITESYVIWNLLNKVELLETWVEDFSDRVAGTWEEIKSIWEEHLWPDKRGGIKPVQEWFWREGRNKVCIIQLYCFNNQQRIPVIQ